MSPSGLCSPGWPVGRASPGLGETTAERALFWKEWGMSEAITQKPALPWTWGGDGG